MLESEGLGWRVLNHGLRDDPVLSHFTFRGQIVEGGADVAERQSVFGAGGPTAHHQLEDPRRTPLRRRQLQLPFLQSCRDTNKESWKQITTVSQYATHLTFFVRVHLLELCHP